jgi:hypothetical protein
LQNLGSFCQTTIKSSIVNFYYFALLTQLWLWFSWWPLSQAYAGAAAVLVDEFDAGGLQSRADFLACFVSPTQWTIPSLQALDGRYRYVSRSGQFLLGPSQKRPSSLNLPN